MNYAPSRARVPTSPLPTLPALPASRPPPPLQGEPTVHSRLGDEKATNPFLRPHDPAIRQQLGFDAAAPDWQVFGAIRAAKDRF